MSAPLGRLRLPWVDLPLFGLLLACAPVCALPDLPEQVGLGPGGASLLERAALPQVIGLAQVQRLVTGRLGSVHVLRRLNETFGDTPLDRITRQMVDEWYANARDTLTAWTFEQAARTLKRIMLAAANEQADGTPPLIPASPCRAAVGSSVLIDNRRNAGRNR